MWIQASLLRGGMKDVYFSPDKSYVVAFYRDVQDYNAKELLIKIVTQYYDSFFKREGGDYYKDLLLLAYRCGRAKPQAGYCSPNL